MAGTDEEFDAQLADRGDDRPGLDELEGDDFGDLDPEEDEFDEDDGDEDDYPEDATDEEIDLVGAFFREDGQADGLALARDLANDLDGLIDELRRVPGEAGSLGVVSIDSDFFVLVRVRGNLIQVLLSDAIAANDWPIARDAADFLGVDIPEDDDESEPVGDLDMFVDVGLPELELEALCADLDSDPLEIIEAILTKVGFADAYDKVASSFDL